MNGLVDQGAHLKLYSLCYWQPMQLVPHVISDRIEFGASRNNAGCSEKVAPTKLGRIKNQYLKERYSVAKIQELLQFGCTVFNIQVVDIFIDKGVIFVGRDVSDTICTYHLQNKEVYVFFADDRVRTTDQKLWFDTASYFSNSLRNLGYK